MTRYETDAPLWLPSFVSVNLWAAQYTVRDTRNASRIAAKEATHAVTESAVPLAPGITYEASHLI
jgi:hypothetical protein